MSALRVGSPNSLRPRITKARTSIGKVRETSSTSGKSVKKQKVISTKGFLVDAVGQVGHGDVDEHRRDHLDRREDAELQRR